MRTLAAPAAATLDVLSAYRGYCESLPGLEHAWRRRVGDASAFLAVHPDLHVWMDRPLVTRLADLRRRPRAWPLISHAMLTGRLRADVGLLAGKNAGQSLARITADLYPEELNSLSSAAGRLGLSVTWTSHVLTQTLPLVVAECGRAPASLTVQDLDRVHRGLRSCPVVSASMRRAHLGRLHALRRLLYEARIIDAPAARRRGDGPASRAQHLQVVAAAQIRHTMLAYLDVRSSVLRPASQAKLVSNLASFGEYLTVNVPELATLARLERRHVEGYLAWSATRPWRGSRACDRPIGRYSAVHAVLCLRTFLDDIAAWGWADSPPRRLVFPADVPRPPQPLPRALAPDVDRAVMAAVAELADPFARVGLQVLRGTGLRVGELLDLELDCVLDYGAQGSWLRVPLGKLNTERTVPLDEPTLAALVGWLATRGPQRALPRPRDGRLADFVFTTAGRRPGPRPLQQGLSEAVRASGLAGADGTPLHVVTHQLRHTFATALANAGMSIQALMALLGHTSPQMTLRYATLASPTLRTAYDEAIGKIRPRLPIAPVGRPIVPDRVGWLSAEMLKTRVAHGYCSRDLVAEACAYANICEGCSNFITAPKFLPALQDQLTDVQALHADAEQRGWQSEAARHAGVITSLESQLRRLETSRHSQPTP